MGIGGHCRFSFPFFSFCLFCCYSIILRVWCFRFECFSVLCSVICIYSLLSRVLCELVSRVWCLCGLYVIFSGHANSRLPSLSFIIHVGKWFWYPYCEPTQKVANQLAFTEAWWVHILFFFPSYRKPESNTWFHKGAAMCVIYNLLFSFPENQNYERAG